MESEADAAVAAADQAFARRGCCCFWVPWPTGGAKVWERMRPATAAAAEQRSEGGRWWSRGWRVLAKVREWSELLAGPRWKTFIRRFGRNGAARRGRFQYDPLSYALNFDEGAAGVGDPEPDARYRDFSARYAAPPASAKSSMDLGGGRDSPPLFVSTPVSAIPAH